MYKLHLKLRRQRLGDIFFSPQQINKQTNKQTKTTVEPPTLYKINKFGFSSKIPSLIEKSPPLLQLAFGAKPV